MIIDLTRLNSGILKKIPIYINYFFSKEELKGTELIELNDVKISGNIEKTNIGHYINLNIKGVMVLPCSVTLKNVNYDFNVDISDDLLEILQEIDENTKKIENSLDIFPIVWENILMEIPIRVVSNDASDIKLEGDGWKLISDGN